MALQATAMRNDPQLQAAANNQPPLRLGMKGSGVKIMQACLIRIGFSMPITTCQNSREPDGIFGEETRTVVGKFQQREGLSADGIAGHDTLHRLDQLQPAEPTPVVGPPVFSPTTNQAKDQLMWRTFCHWT